MRIPIATALALALLITACSTGGGASGTPASGVTTAADAAAAVTARTPLFDGIGPRDPNVIGQSAAWTATPGDTTTPPGRWTVTFEIGWGDCQAGCIDRHTWTYTVGRAGDVQFDGEAGSPMTDDLIAARIAAARGPGVGGRVTAGPVCPVQRAGDTTCQARLVSGAALVVKAGDGTERARVRTDASGLYRIPLPAGDYTLEPQQVEGLMGTPGPLPFTVAGTALTPLDVQYDTGIR